MSTTIDDGGVTSDEGTSGDGSSSGDGASADDATPADGSVAVDTGPADTAVQDSYCERLQKRAMTCGGSFDLGECTRNFTCYMTIMNPDDRTPLFECFATRDCMTSDDACVAKISSKYAADPAIQAYTKSCLDKRSACQASGTTFSDDYCGYDHGLLKPEVRTQLGACLVKDCPAVKGCLDNVYKVYGCGG